MDRTAKVRLGALLVGAGAGGFVTATVLDQLWRWRVLTGDDGGSTTWEPWALGIVGALARLALWSTVVVGIGLLWAASEQGGRRLPAGAIAVRALMAWGVVMAALGIAGLVVERDRPTALDVGVVLTGAIVAALAWRSQRTRSFDPGPPDRRPRSGPPVSSTRAGRGSRDARR